MGEPFQMPIYCEMRIECRINHPKFLNICAMKKALILSIVVVLVACKAAKVSAPGQSDVDRVKDKYPDYTLADLNEGKKLYEMNCGSCHALKAPNSETEEEWIKIVPAMTQKVNRKGVVLDEQAEEQILRYVITMSSASGGGQ